MSNSPSKQYILYVSWLPQNCESCVKSLCIAKLRSFYKSWWIFKFVITLWEFVPVLRRSSLIQRLYIYYNNYIDWNCINDAKFIYEWHCHRLHAIFLWTHTKPHLKNIKMAVKMHILHFKDTLLAQSCMHDKHVYKDHQRITLTFLPKKTRLLTFSKICSIKLIVK